MTKTRIPTQKRSIEKRDRIIKAGFQLFCQKGYYKTNTAEIATYAEVSTGALYSYFEDKRQIFIEAFQQYLDEMSSTLLTRLTALSETADLLTWIENWISIYIDLYGQSNHALVQLRLVIDDEEEINRHFSGLESAYFSNIAAILETRGITCENLLEKIYMACVLIDSLRQEKMSFSHAGLSYEIMKEQVKQSVFQMLSA